VLTVDFLASRTGTITDLSKTAYFWPVLAWTAWTGGLTAHGIATLIAWNNDAPASPPPSTTAARPHFAFAPALVGDPSNALPGVEAFGRF
jgi:hypothetical protein